MSEIEKDIQQFARQYCIDDPVFDRIAAAAREVEGLRQDGGEEADGR